MRWLAILPLVLFTTILAIACEPEEEEAATPAPTVTPAPDGTPAAALAPEVAAVVQAVLAGDQEALGGLVLYAETGCATGPLQVGGPPECRPDEPDGTLVDVLLVLGCEGHNIRSDEIDEAFANLIARKPKLYGVYPVFPDYKAILSVEGPEPGRVSGMALGIEDGEIMFIDFGCGESPEQLALALPTASPEPTGTLTPSPAVSPTLPVALEEGAPVTEVGLHLVETTTGRLWRLEGSGAWSPDGKRLARWNCCLGGGGLDVIDLPAGPAVRIFDGGVDTAAWSPDGTQIAFSRWGEGPEGVHVVNSDGSGLRQLWGRGTHAVGWSASGDRFAFARGERIYLLHVPSGEVTDVAQRAHDLAWSPDGTTLAFTDDTGLYIYDPDTVERRQLAAGPSGGPILWSPDGAKIAYLSDGCVTGNWDIYTVGPDGSSEVRLTSTPETVKEGPYWSPTGASIAFSTFGELILLDAESGELRTLVVSGWPETAGRDIHLHGPVWSPDGRYIQFTAGTAHGICD